jgi:hypothetical protein
VESLCLAVSNKARLRESSHEASVQGGCWAKHDAANDGVASPQAGRECGLSRERRFAGRR